MDSKKMFTELYKKIEVLPTKCVVGMVAYYDDGNEKLANVRTTAKYDKYQFAQLIQDMSNDEESLNKYTNTILKISDRELNRLYLLFLERMYEDLRQGLIYDEHDEEEVMRGVFKYFAETTSEEVHSNG